MKLKTRVIILILTLGIYMVLTYIYNNVLVDKNLNKGYVLLDSVKKGQKVSLENLTEIKYKIEGDVNISIPNVLNENLVFSDDYEKGEFLKENMLISNDEFNNIKEDNEIVAINVSEIDDNLCNTIKRGMKVNIYASAKTSELEKIINLEDKESFSNGSLSGFTTIKILQDVEILNCYDESGGIALENIKVENILIQVDKDMAIKINNLKNYCEFSLSQPK